MPRYLIVGIYKERKDLGYGSGIFRKKVYGEHIRDAVMSFINKVDKRKFVFYDSVTVYPIGEHQFTGIKKEGVEYCIRKFVN